MEQKPDVDLVNAAIQSLYHNPESSEKDRASKWLADLQKSVHAWTVADEMLHCNPGLEACYFAAQTMRTKIHQSFHELPVEAHASLRDSLLDHISMCTEGTNSIIVTQLCLALADLVLQMPAWPKATLELIARFNQSHLWPLLEILTVLPEELESRSVRLGENRRQEMLEDFRHCAATVNEFLQHCNHTYGADVHTHVQINTKIVRCFNSWISVGVIGLPGVHENAVVTTAIAILSYKQETMSDAAIPGALHDACTDCIGVLLQSLEDNNNQQHLEMYLFNSVIGLDVPYHLSMVNEEQEKCMNYCRLFTDLGETFLEKIIGQRSEESQHYALEVLDRVLLCVGHHDYEVAEITFNMWYMLSEKLYEKNNKALTEMFRPYVERLLVALCRHCRMDEDQEGLLDDADDFKDFRNKVLDLVKDVVFIVGSATCFRQMFLNLQQPGSTWDAIEASLFIMQAVAKNILPTENEIVPKVVEAILNLEPVSTHVAVRHTSLLLLGELAEWIEEHPVVMDLVLNALVLCLGCKDVSAAAAAALQVICTRCSRHMAHHIPILLQLARQVDTFAITNNDIIGLLIGIAEIVNCAPERDMAVALREMCLIQTVPLVQLLESNAEPVRGSKNDPIALVDRLSAIFRKVNVGADEGRPVILEVWPIMSKCLEQYQTNARIMERTSRCLRFMLRCCNQKLRDILSPLVLQMIAIYTAHRHSCFLYLGSILVDVYGMEPDCVQGLLEMLQAFIQPTFASLTAENGIRNNPDMVDDFFRLCTRFLQRAPLVILRCSTLPHIIECGLMACSLVHKEANTTVMKFFVDLISSGRYDKTQPDFRERNELVNQILAEYGHRLVHSLIHACAFYLHTYMLCEVGDVFRELLVYDKENTGKWLADVLSTIPKNANGIITVTDQQLNDFHVSVMRSQSSKSVTSALKDLTRLYR